jgi:membrane fusion protein, multidrug efflux system
VLGKIETSGTGDVWRSAQASVMAAEQDLRVADKDLERAKRLAEAGALSPHDLELAESQRLSAEARLGGARAQLSSAGSQLGRTTLKSPLAGVVSERAARVGDVVSPGSPMFTVIEPSSLRLEASVPASAVSMVQVGAAVEFEVQGYPGRTIEGTIDRVSPAVDPVTRQIPVLVTVPNAGHALVAGLFADGRIANDLHQGLVVPLSAIDETGAVPVVLQVREGTVVRTEVELGTHDDATESVEVVRGLAVGDLVILGSAGDVEPGAHVTVQAPAAGEG